MLEVSPAFWLTICSGLLAIVSYGYFSRAYEPLTRTTPNPLYSAAILYFGAALVLGPLSLLAIGIWGRADFSAPVVVLNRSFSSPTAIMTMFLLLVLGMSWLYFAHIATEATARFSMNMGAYTLVFQVYVVVIAGLDWLFYHVEPTWYVLLGGFLLLSSSMGVTLAQSKMGLVSEMASARRFRGGARSRNARKYPSSIIMKRALQLGIISALVCGGALYIDGEIGRNYILRGGLSISSLGFFLGYETLTFLIPALWVFALLRWRQRRSPARVTLGKLWEEYRAHWRGYSVASVCSASQFVFSVFALSLPGPRFIAVMILGATPLLTVFMDQNLRMQPQSKEREREYLLACVGIVGFVLMAIKL